MAIIIQKINYVLPKYFISFDLLPLITFIVPFCIVSVGPVVSHTQFLDCKINISFFLLFFSNHPQTKHYHIKQNSRGEFYLSDKHCCPSIPELINYHKHNSGGLCSRLKTTPCDRPAPPTAGLSHGKNYYDSLRSTVVPGCQHT